MKFEEKYFKEIYKQPYYKRNPKYKIKALLREIRRYKDRGKLLDIGCAYGLFLKKAKKYFNVSGCDISKYAINIAKKNLSSDTDLRADGIENISFKNKQFDVVTVFDTIEHVPDLNKAFSEMKRVLKKEGIMVLTIPLYTGIAGKIVNKLDHDPTHIHKKDIKFWFDLLEKNNIKILDYIGVFRYFLLHKFYIQILNKLVRNHAPMILVIAKQK